MRIEGNFLNPIMGNKLIYEFSGKKTDGDASLNNLLGGKGANLAEMSKLGIQVPRDLLSQPKFVVIFQKIKNYRMD